MARHARELARSLGREVEVELAGEDTQLDRRITRELEERPGPPGAQRRRPRHRAAAACARRRASRVSGRLRIEAAAPGSKVRLTISDDGAGIDPARVVEAAVAGGPGGRLEGRAP